MREITLPQSKSKLRLLDAAEQLFAEKGFESVSVRDVTQAAKANVAAVNYHFGSRDGMIALVVARYVTPINQERLARLDALERKWGSKAAPLEEILEAFVRPVVGTVRKSELSERLFCKLIGRVFALQGDGVPVAVEEQMKESIRRFTRSLGRALPTLTQEELVWRLHFLVGSLIHMMLNQEMLHRLSNGAAGDPTMDVTLARFIRFAAAGLREGVEVEPETKKGPQALFDF